MLHIKFQDSRPFGSREEDFLNVFAIYSPGGHLGHVTRRCLKIENNDDDRSQSLPIQ